MLLTLFQGNVILSPFGDLFLIEPLSVLPRIFGRPGGLLTEIFKSACTKPAVARIKFHWEFNFSCSLG